jgi:carbamoyl-phosphate synthase large subunit
MTDASTPPPAVPPAVRPAIPRPRQPLESAPSGAPATATGPAAPPAVLVTGSGGPAGVAVVRRLVALGHRVVAGDADRSAAGGALADASVVLPRADHPRFLDAVLGAAAAYGVDALIGTVAEELPALTAGVDRLTAAGIGTWLPDLAAVDLCCDKAAFAERMHAAGVPHPATATTGAGAAGVPGPWVVKPREGRGSRGVQLLDRLGPVVTALGTGPDLVVQTRLTGREFTADALVGRDGDLLTVVPRWRDETKAGISVKGTTFDSEAVTDLVRDTLAAVGLTGPANVQGFVADDGTATVVEVNPRFSGGLPLTLAAGADVVSAYLAGVREPGRELPLLWFTPGVSMSRYFAETYTGPDGRPLDDPCTPATAAAAVRA